MNFNLTPTPCTPWRDTARAAAQLWAHADAQENQACVRAAGAVSRGGQVTNHCSFAILTTHVQIPTCTSNKNEQGKKGQTYMGTGNKPNIEYLGEN